MGTLAPDSDGSLADGPGAKPLPDRHHRSRLHALATSLNVAKALFPWFWIAGSITTMGSMASLAGRFRGHSDRDLPRAQATLAKAGDKT